MTSTLETKPEHTIAPGEPPPPYKMPLAWTGLLAIHRPSGDSPNTRGTTFIITKVGSETVNGMIVAEGNRMLVEISGARHITDPQKMHPQFEQYGTWDYSPETKLILKLAKELGLDPNVELQPKK